MKGPLPRAVAAAQLLLIFPAALFMGSLVVRSLFHNHTADAAQAIVMWYAGRHWTLWILLIALPLAVLVSGGMTFVRNWGAEPGQRASEDTRATIPQRGLMGLVAATTLASGVVLVIVILHMLAN